MSSNPLKKYKRIVIKIGSSLLIDANSSSVRVNWLKSIANDIAKLKKDNIEIIIVSSGAVMLGRGILGLSDKNLALEKLQASASVGQIALLQEWGKNFAQHEIKVGQILITPDITEERRRYINARTTILTLLEIGIVPIINENDSVATAEIRYGDNDRLSARVATMVDADCLIILSDVDGLYTHPPQSEIEGNHLLIVKSITKEIEAMAGEAASHLARGGMKTKIEAAKIATQAGTDMIITSGVNLSPLKALTNGAKHTLFEASECPKAAKKRWILGSLEMRGRIYIDGGAAIALSKGKSLLPIGVVKILGDFMRGDAVGIFDDNENEIARGLVGMNFEDAIKAKGKKSQEIFEFFNAQNRSELVHADNLVLINIGGNSDE
jgi:glutamate 5-kinase